MEEANISVVILICMILKFLFLFCMHVCKTHRHVWEFFISFFHRYVFKTLGKCLDSPEYFLLLYSSSYISASKSQKSSSYLATSWALNRIVHDKCSMYKCTWIIWKGILAHHIFSPLWVAISVHNNDYSLRSLSDVLVGFRRKFSKL